MLAVLCNPGFSGAVGARITRDHAPHAAGFAQVQRVGQLRISQVKVESLRIAGFIAFAMVVGVKAITAAFLAAGRFGAG
jgi:hypothetical protein